MKYLETMDPTNAKKNEETIKRVEKKLNKELEDGTITMDQLQDRVSEMFGIGKGSLYNEFFGERR